MDNAPMHTPSFSDKVAANAAFDIAFRGDAESIDADMAQLFANEKAELLEALQGWDKLHADMVLAGGSCEELPPHLVEQFAVTQAELMDLTRTAITKATKP